jgi:hypothetical protein
MLKQTTRRLISALLVVLGAALIFLATQAWSGLLLVGLGLAIELIAFVLKLKNR